MKNTNKNRLRIRFLGAIGTVTGSCTLLEYTSAEDNIKHYYLVDAGVFENENSEHEKEREKLLKQIAEKIEIIFITHAHLDHIGILGDLIDWGFKGKICSTNATFLVLIQMLSHSDDNITQKIKKIKFFDIEGSHRNKSQNGPGKTYHFIARNLWVGYLRTSHIIGSCAFFFRWSEDYIPLDETYKEEITKNLDKEKIIQDDYKNMGILLRKELYFTGDIGPVSENQNGKILPNILFKEHQTPYWDDKDKCIIMESTYGEKIRDKENLFIRKIENLSRIIDETINNNGKVIIPAFALDRAQQILLDLYYILKQKEIIKIKEILGDDKADNWKNVLKYIFYETMIKDIIKPVFFHELHLPCKIRTLHGKENKQLRNEIKDEIANICSENDISPKTLYKDIPDEYQSLISDIFISKGIELPDLDDAIVMHNKINFSFYFSQKKQNQSSEMTLIEKINKIYFNCLTEEEMRLENIDITKQPDITNKRKKERKFKYLSKEFIRLLNLDNDIPKDDNYILKLQEKVSKILSIFLFKNNDPKIIVAASGMCEKGSIKSLLKKYLTDENATIILTGFQADNTNGKMLKNLIEGKYDDEKKATLSLELQGRDIKLIDIKCRIEDLSQFYSGHADKEQLIDYLTPNKDALGKTLKNTGKVSVLLNHGSDEARNSLKTEIENRNDKIKVMLPEFNKWLNIASLEYEEEDIKIVEYFELKAKNIIIKYPSDFDSEKIKSLIEFIEKL